MHNEVIVERGNNWELLDIGGHYATLVPIRNVNIEEVPLVSQTFFEGKKCTIKHM